jgi:DNA polymerase III epsilon subunit-like protein
MQKRYAVIDTETSGLFDFSKPADAEGQPRLANLAIIMLYDDLTLHAEHDFLIKPDGWEMGAEAGAVNGLTTETLNDLGRPVGEVLRAYSALIEEGYIVATFNAQFDTKVMRGEMRRAGVPDLFERTPNVCIMRALTPICKVPKKSGAGYKFPKLSEACAFFKIDEPKAHSALGDARSAAALLRELGKLNAIPAPEVHYAKNPPTPIPPKA